MIEINDKKSDKIALIISLIVIMLLCGYIGYDKIIDKNDNNSKTTKNEETKEQNNNETSNERTNKEVSEEVLNELYDIIGSANGDCVDYFTPLFFDDGYISDYNKELKNATIYKYAYEHNMLYTISQLEVDGELIAGDGYYSALREDDYYRIAKKYGIKDKFEDFYDRIYQNKALYDRGGYACGHIIEATDVFAKYEGEYVILYETIKVSDIDSKEELETVKKKFTFNKLSDGSYALYKVESE